MHVNPCGRAVDWIQFPFEVDARILSDADAPIVRQRWMFTDQPFLPVGTGCVLMNRIWDDDPSEYRVGMLEPGTNNFKQDARWVLPADLLPGHVCQDEWLSTGEPPNDLPPTIYDEHWIPSCCPRVEQLRGGAEVGGEVGDVHHFIWGDTCCDAPLLESGVTYHVDKTLHVFEALVFRYQGAPGLYNFSINFSTPYDLSSLIHATSGPGCGNQPISQFLQTYSGDYPITLSDSSVICISFSDNSNVPVRFTFTLSALPPPVWVDGTAGGAEIGGAAGDVFRGDNATEGGAEIGGEVGDVGPPDDPTEGGGEIGGEVGDTTPPTDATEGGGEIGGDVGDMASGTDATEGGGQLGGAAGDVASGIDGTEGGEQLGGAVGDVFPFIDGTEGGEQLGGAAGDTYTAPVPTFDTLSSGTLASGWTQPAPVRTGALLVAFVATGPGAQTPGSGWHQEQQIASSTGGAVIGCYTRVATGSDPAPITGGVGQYVCYQMKYWNAVNASAASADTGASTSAVAPSVAVTAPGYVLRGFASANQGVGTVYVGAGTVTKVTSAVPNLGAGRLATNTNPSGTATANLPSSQTWAAVTISIR